MKSGYKCSVKRIAALAVMVCMLVFAGLAFTSVVNTKAESVIAQGHVNYDVTNLRIRKSPVTGGVITTVDGGFKFDIYEEVNTDSGTVWYSIGFSYNGSYTRGYVTSSYTTIDNLFHSCIELLEYLNCTFLCNLVDTLDELLSLHSINLSYSCKMFWCKCRYTLKCKFLIRLAYSITNRENTRIKYTYNISCICLIYNMSLLRHHLLWLAESYFLATLNMVIDASKGVEKQTIKLFKVCVMRHIPIFTFINKMDREANDPFELLDEIESVLGISTCPINWPIGCGKEFKGVYDRKEKNVSLFKAAMNGQKEVDTEIVDASDEAVLKDRIGDAFYDKLQEDIELLDGASAEFDQEMVSAGDLTPVFFGSALTNFGVQTFLEHFLSMTTSPLPRKSDQGIIDPFTEDFSAFVFKIQANMNKAHRDRIAFMRICSGKFEAGMEAAQV
jgi:hypothetical protein